jgi:hypothetical protein
MHDNELKLDGGASGRDVEAAVMSERRKIAATSLGKDVTVTGGDRSERFTHSAGGFSPAKNATVYEEGDSYLVVVRERRLFGWATRQIRLPKWNTTIEEESGSVIAALLGLRR